MPLAEELARRGNWLFRWRSYLPLAMLGVVLLAMREFTFPAGSELLDDLWEIVCLTIAFLGLTVRVLTVGRVPGRTSGRNTEEQIADELNTTGIYSLMRNPLYLGNFVIGLGISLFVRTWWVTLIYMLAFWLYYERIILAEEAYLRGKFGEEYLRWAEKTPVFFPRFANWQPSSMAFSVRTVLKREYSGFFGIIATFTFLEVVGDLFVLGRFELDPMWVCIFTVGLCVYLTLRTMKKRGMLSVEGR